MTKPIKAAIIGSGNIGTDLMLKIVRKSNHLGLVAMVGIDSESDGLARARRLGVTAIDTGVKGLIADNTFNDIEVVFDATSAAAHHHNAMALTAARPGIRIIDLTPAAIGPYYVPSVNADEHLDEQNLNMVTCGGQATIPVIAAISSVVPVRYAEIVASIASKSAGPGTRANIDEFTETTSAAICSVGGAEVGKAIIILNPAEPPLMMRDTVYGLTRTLDEAERAQIIVAVETMVSDVAEYVPGYQLKQKVQFDEITNANVSGIDSFTGTKVSVFLQIEGSADYLPSYAGNLDIMTSAALRAGENVAARRHIQKA